MDTQRVISLLKVTKTVNTSVESMPSTCLRKTGAFLQLVRRPSDQESFGPRQLFAPTQMTLTAAPLGTDRLLRLQRCPQRDSRGGTCYPGHIQEASFDFPQLI